MARVLMVAEKPSIAESISRALSKNYTVRKGVSKICTVYEFPGKFFTDPCTFIVTSVCGHIFSTDFPRQYNNWDSVDPLDLYDADTIKIESPTKGGSIVKHLQQEASACSYLVLWLDCDREGENICYEVIDIVKPLMRKSQYEQIYRAKFSSLAPEDLRKAMEKLGVPNKNEALAVDARQILDLKIGVSFTRFQTKFFQGKYGNLDSKLISYGPCQTPTLGFCVKRHDEILSFKPEPFYTVHITSRTAPSIRFHHVKGHMKHQPTAQGIYQKLLPLKAAGATVISIDKSKHKSKKPQGLNTVQLLKLGSTHLGMSPHMTMGIAEHLYLSGFVTYPRTESTAYAPNFDLKSVIHTVSHNEDYSEFCADLLDDGYKKPHKGLDAGDHPPITPCSVDGVKTLGRSERALFDLITRYFLATVSKDAVYEKILIKVSMEDEEFLAEGSVTVHAGFSAMTPWLCGKERELPVLNIGENVQISDIELNTDYTTPPSHISESELLGMMEHHGIGTDASMSVHINNICERNYVKVESGSRRLVPTQLGVTLVHGYYLVDKDLVLPKVRSEIEKSVSLIAKGTADFQSTVQYSINLFKEKFKYYMEQIVTVDQLFEAIFSPLAQSSGKRLTKCGRCYRYMNLLSLRPCRLYCPNCELTYKLPQNGIIKAYKEQRCPVDGFELVIYRNDRYSIVLCPACYNDPPFEGTKPGLTCLSCPQYECPNNLYKHLVAGCPKCEADMVLSDLNKPLWRLLCIECHYAETIFEGAKTVELTEDFCDECGAVILKAKYEGKEKQECYFCGEYASLLRDGRPESARGRGGRGRGGRGGRGGRRGGRGGRRGGRGRGRGGRRYKEAGDNRMSFEDF